MKNTDIKKLAQEYVKNLSKDERKALVVRTNVKGGPITE